MRHEDVYPHLVHWIRSIGEPGYPYGLTSLVNDQIKNYLLDSSPNIENLFARFGYKIIRFSYEADDFDFDRRIKSCNNYSNKLALSLAKAANLVYQDKAYIAEIATQWGIFPKRISANMSTKQKLRDKNFRDYITSIFRYFYDKEHDTQAFMFQTKKCIVLALRGSQGMRDWQTTVNTRPRPFSIRPADGKEFISSSYKGGKVHTGFFLEWVSIERDILIQLDDWEKVRIKKGQTLPPLLVTGHSLGGALATMAAASLQENGIKVTGVYTFGQPRVGDGKFSSHLNKKIAGKFFRFVNNNDVVPHLPPPWLTGNLFRLYKHTGSLKYFNYRGFFVHNYDLHMRVIEAISGVIKLFSEPTLDLMDDHSMQDYIKNLNKTLQKDNTNSEYKKIKKQEAENKRV
ncbi:MAG: lipase family protein [Bacteroidota bacterium]